MLDMTHNIFLEIELQKINQLEIIILKFSLDYQGLRTTLIR